MNDILIGVVGPCGAGKTTLSLGLRSFGFRAKPIAQEHSYVPAMWQRLTKPDILIYLEVSYPFTILRRQLDWTAREYGEQLHRLRHAKEHADISILTDNLTARQVLDQALELLKSNI